MPDNQRTWRTFFSSLFQDGKWGDVAGALARGDDRGDVPLSPEDVSLLRRVEAACWDMARDLFGRGDRRSGSSVARGALDAACRHVQSSPAGLLRFSRWARHMARRRRRLGLEREARFFEEFADIALVLFGREGGVRVFLYVLEGVVAYV